MKSEVVHDRISGVDLLRSRQRVVRIWTFLTLVVSVGVGVLWPSAVVAAGSAPTYCHWFDEGGEWTGLAECTRYDGVAAAAYADFYAADPNITDFQVYDSDCANFVSQAMMAGGHSFIFINAPDIPRPVLYDDQLEWWAYRDPASGVYGSGRTRSWSLVDDFYEYLYQRGSPYSTGFAFQEPGSQSDLPNVDIILDPWSEVWDTVSIPTPIGSVVVYQWEATPEDIGEWNFSPDHTSIATAYGTDPDSGWSGLLVGQHTTNRHHAIWHLIPYNALYASAATVILALGNNALDTVPQAQSSQSLVGCPRPRSQSPLPRPKHKEDFLSFDLGTLDQGIALDDRKAVTATFESAMSLRQRIGVSDREAESGIQSHQIVELDKAKLGQVFAGPQLRQEIQNFDSALLLRESAQVQAVDGGADGFQYSTISRNEKGQVVLVGSFRAWATVAQVQSDGSLVPANPSNKVDFFAVVDLADGTYKVSSLQWTFAPGSQP